MQLDLCPSYPSKSQEEQGRLELQERKRKKRPLGLDGCDKMHLSLILFLIPSALPFLQVTLMAGSPLAELRHHRLPSNLVLQITFLETSRWALPLHRCCPPATTNFPSPRFKNSYTPLFTILLSTFFCFLYF